eukprot:6201440-Pleurochrysis_carterae.AAC.1
MRSSESRAREILFLEAGFVSSLLCFYLMVGTLLQAGRRRAAAAPETAFEQALAFELAALAVAVAAATILEVVLRRLWRQ